MNVSNTFSVIQAGAAPVDLTATVANDPHFKGVTWSLGLAGVACSPGCGTIATTGPLTATYTPPKTPPTNQSATIAAVSIDNHRSVFAFNFSILATISVAITNKFSSIKAGGAPVALNAQVTEDPANAGVSWSLTAGGTNCSPVCGTLNVPAAPTFTATYTPPATEPIGANASPTITATSVTESNQSDSFNFNILPAIAVSILNKFTTQSVGGGPVVVNASVSNDSTNSGVSWTLTAAGSNCSPACGSLVASAAPSFNATYTPPATPPSGSNVSPEITAVSVADNTKNDSFTFAIAVSSTQFSGSYAILMRGFDMSGSPVAFVGSIFSDGNNNITGGELDIDNGGGITHIPSPITGTYSLDNSFNGVVRGTVTITSYTSPISFKFVLSSDSSRGKILELDGLGFLVVGTILRQDPGALSAANPEGSYAFGLDSDAPVGGRTVAAGQLVLGSNSVMGGLIDESRAGGPMLYFDETITAGTLTAPDSNGRGTLAITVNPAKPTSTAPSSTTLYAYYIVNSGQLNLIQADHGATLGTVQAGVARLQKLPFSSNTISATSVLQLTGMDVSPITQNIGPQVIVGVMTSTAPNAFLLTWDENDIGTAYIAKQTGVSVSSFDQTTGRAVLSDQGGFGVGFMDLAVAYLHDTGSGFVIDADPSTCVPVSTCPNGPPAYTTTNNALSGSLTPQASGPFGPQTLTGNALFSIGATAIDTLPDFVGALHFSNTTTDNVSYPYTATGDYVSLLSQDGNAPNVSFAAVYFPPNPQDPAFALGHGGMQLPQTLFGVFPSNKNQLTFFYLIGPNQGVGIAACTTGNCQNSGIYTFEPQ